MPFDPLSMNSSDPFLSLRAVTVYTKIHRPFFRLLMFGCSFFSGLLIAASFTMESSWSKVIYLGYPFDLLMVATLFCTCSWMRYVALGSLNVPAFLNSFPVRQSEGSDLRV